MATYEFLTTTSASVQLYTLPAGAIVAEGIGPGGNGSARNSNSTGGYGGGGGSYAKFNSTSVTTGKTVGYFLPAAGSAADTRFYDLNTLLNTNGIGGTSWTLLNTTVTTGQTDPFGGTNAVSIVENGVNSAHNIYQNTGAKPASVATTYTISAYLKANGRNYGGCDLEDSAGANRIEFEWNLTTGALTNSTSFGTGYTLISTSSTDVGDGWWRVTATVSINNTATNVTYVVYPSNLGTTYIYAGTNGLAAIYAYGVNCNYGTLDRGYNVNTSTTVQDYLWKLKAKAGTNATTAAIGSGQSDSIGDTTFQGGNGAAPTGASGGGGGGAAGPEGIGGNASGTTGGSANGGATSGGAAGAVGNNGTDFDATHGAGSGAGGQTTTGSGLTGGSYGGAGSGSGTNAGSTGGPGVAGILAISYGFGSSYGYIMA